MLTDMRINQYVALATGISRRRADTLIEQGRVLVNDQVAKPGTTVEVTATVTLDDRRIQAPAKTTTIMLNKPIGYVCSRDGQGSKTVYDLLPSEYQQLKTIGRLDKDSSGLLLLTNDGVLANQLSHPSHEKLKLYEVQLITSLGTAHRKQLLKGVELEDGISTLKTVNQVSDRVYEVTLAEGRNRQIRRTFAAIGHTVQRLHRTQFGPYTLGVLDSGKYKEILL